MAQGFVDRLLTIVVTATLTSAAWIVVGSGYIDTDGTAGPAAKEKKSPVVASKPQAAAVVSEKPMAEAPEPGELGALVVPVRGVTTAQLSDTFTDARGGGARLHEALDIMAPAGTPVIAAAPGTVEKLFRSDAGGNTVYIRSADGRTIHYYAHLQAYAPDLKEGQSVSRAQVLGSVGSTGNANPEAPHLHFAILRTTPDAEWWEPATALNPFRLLKEPK